MDGKLIGAGISLGVILLLLAVAMPTMIATPLSNQTTTLEINQDTTKTVTDDLELTLDTISETDNNATITLTDTDAQNQSSLTLNVSETKNTTLEEEFLNATLDEVRDNSTGVLTIEYPSTYGWHPGAVVVIQNLDVVLAGIVLLVPLGFGFMVLRRRF